MWRMWRMILAVCSLASVALSQSAGISAAGLVNIRSSQASVSPVPDRPALTISIYQRYSELRRGSEQEVAVIVCMVPGRFLYCPDYGSSTRSDLAPVALHLESPSGLSVRYWGLDKYQIQPNGAPTDMGTKQVFLLKLHAADYLPLGRHILNARLTLRVGDQGPGGVWRSNGVVQEIHLQLPINVVERRSPILEAANWPTKSHRTRNLQQSAASFVGAAPQFSLLWAWCHIDDCDAQFPIP